MLNDRSSRLLNHRLMATVKRWLKRAGYAVFLLVCVELALQAYYRLTTGSFLFQRTSVPIFIADEHRGWAVKPNLNFQHTTNEFSVQYHTNQDGMRVSPRGETFTTTKDSSRYRIMLLGPSFAFGWAANFDDSIAGRLEQSLQTRGFAADRDVEILNAGVPSLPPANNLHWYKNVGEKYKPDLIIQFIHGSMAVYNRVQHDYTANASGYLIRTHPSKATRLRHFAKHFGLVFYTWSAYTNIKKTSPTPVPSNSSTNTPEPLASARSIQGALDTARFDPQDPMAREAIDFFVDLHAAARSSGSQLLVVYFPPAYGVHRADASRWMHDGVIHIDRQIAFNDAFCDYLNQHNIACLNLHDPLTSHAKRTNNRLYYWLDTHWTPRGNQVAANAIARHLSANHEIPLSGN